MIFYVLASLIVFTLVISHNVRKSKRLQSQNELGFWEKERLANQTRRKSLDGLDYIKIPLDTFPTERMKEEEKVAECLRMINYLATQPIVNLTGYTNTDLKLEYGASNITSLIEYDQNYTLLVSTLQQWAELLYQAGYQDDVIPILEFAVSTRSDVRRTYAMLSDIYVSQGRTDKLTWLRETAQTLQSLNKDVILKKLSEY